MNSFQCNFYCMLFSSSIFKIIPFILNYFSPFLKTKIAVNLDFFPQFCKFLKTEFVDRVPSDKPRRHVCDTCGAAFARYSSLWSHRRLHTGDFCNSLIVCLCFSLPAAMRWTNHSTVTCVMAPSVATHLCGATNAYILVTSHLNVKFVAWPSPKPPTSRIMGGFIQARIQFRMPQIENSSAYIY